MVVSNRHHARAAFPQNNGRRGALNGDGSVELAVAKAPDVFVVLRRNMSRDKLQHLRVSLQPRPTCNLVCDILRNSCLNYNSV